MQQKHKSTSDNKPHTHSLIGPQVPSSPKCTIAWCREYPNIGDPHVRSIFQPDIIPKSEQQTGMQYQCTPLDYGAIVRAKIVGDGKVVRECQYGPIGMEEQLGKYCMTPARQNVKVVVNKSTLLDGQATVTTCPFIVNNEYRADVIIKAEQFEMEIKIDKDTKLASGCPFFRFYARQQQALGISIFSQYKELMDKLKNINVFVHSGYYLKLYFESRQFRDVFLVELMQYFGIVIGDINMVSSSVFKMNEQEKSVLGSSILGELKRQSASKEKGREIDDEIYNLLYDKQSQMDNEEQRRVSFSFENAAEFLLSSIRKSGIHKLSHIKSVRDTNYSDINNHLQKDKQKQKKKSEDQATIINFDNRKLSQNSSKEKKSKHTVRQSNLKPSSKTPQNCNKENQMRNTIAKLISQIDNLIRQNRQLSQENKKLSQENKKLKQENMKWRYKEIKKTFKHSIQQKVNHDQRMKTTKQVMRPYTVIQISESSRPSPAKTSSSKYLRKPDVMTLNKFIGSHAKTIESPCSNETIQPLEIPPTGRNKRIDTNFTSCVQIQSKKFIKEDLGEKKSTKFIPRRSKMELKKSGTSKASKTSKSQVNASFNRFEELPATPATPVFAIHSPQIFNLKVHESQFFRRYLAQ